MVFDLCGFLWEIQNQYLLKVFGTLEDIKLPDILDIRIKSGWNIWRCVRKWIASAKRWCAEIKSSASIYNNPAWRNGSLNGWVSVYNTRTQIHDLCLYHTAHLKLLHSKAHRHTYFRPFQTFFISNNLRCKCSWKM